MAGRVAPAQPAPLDTVRLRDRDDAQRLARAYGLA